MGHPELADDPRTHDVRARVDNRQLVNDTITGWTLQLPKAEVVAALAGEVPCGPVNDAEDLFNDPHLRARGMIQSVQLPGNNPAVSIAGPPIKFTETPAAVYRRAPLLDEHRAEILSQFGIREESR